LQLGFGSSQVECGPVRVHPSDATEAVRYALNTEGGVARPVASQVAAAGTRGGGRAQGRGKRRHSRQSRLFLFLVPAGEEGVPRPRVHRLPRVKPFTASR